MSSDHSLASLQAHIVWKTHLRQPLLAPELDVWLTIASHEQALRHGGSVLAAGIACDHVHLLLRYGPTTALPALVQGCKGGLSYLVNRAGVLPAPLRWQRGFWAESVSTSALPRLAAYLQRQRLHHALGTTMAGLEPLTPD